MLIFGLISSAHGACLAESDVMAGIEEGELFSNLEEIRAIGASSASFYSFTTCTDSDGAMRGT